MKGQKLEQEGEERKTISVKSYLSSEGKSLHVNTISCMCPVSLHVIILSVFAPFPISVASIHAHTLPAPPDFPQHVTLRRARRQLDFTSREGEMDQATVSASM